MEATICTVLTPLHQRLMGINYGLIRALNPETPLTWCCVDNRDIHVNDKKANKILAKKGISPNQLSQAEYDEVVNSEKQRYFDRGNISDYVPSAAVLLGPDVKEAVQYFSNSYSIRADNTEKLSQLNKYLGSYHHAAGLDVALSHVTTRFGIVIDPDLYVVRPGWIRDIIDHMIATDTALFGVPWNPRWHQKYRYFPCTHLMVIDFAKLKYRRDLLAPDLLGTRPKYVAKFWQRLKTARQDGLWMLAELLIKHSWSAYIQDKRQRDSIAQSRDTGFRIIDEFKRHPELKYETATPVFDPEIEGFEPDSITRVQYSALVQALLPDERCYVPKKPGAFSRTGFKERGLPDFRVCRWEEFLWKDAPLAVHVRGELHRQRWDQIDIADLLRNLNVILEGYGLAPLSDPATGVERGTVRDNRSQSKAGVAAE